MSKKSNKRSDNHTVDLSSSSFADIREKNDEIKKLKNFNSKELLANYKHLKTIGFGGIGSVLEVEDPDLNRKMAIKVLRPNYKENPRHLASFIREAKITAAIEHPNIVPIHQLGIFEDAGPYFSMKKVIGEDLRSILEHLAANDTEYVKKYNRRRLLEIFIAACNGVAFAHSKGIIHRDLKPANIMIGDYGQILVMDWGLAKSQSELQQSNNSNAAHNVSLTVGEVHTKGKKLTASCSISGTPAFMAPEQAQGKLSEMDERSDLYSLGVILYTILTYKASPFSSELTTNDVLMRVVNGAIKRPRKATPQRKIPRELEAICLKAMALEKENRYRNITELLDDIHNYLDSFPVKAYPLPLYQRIWKLFKRHPLVPVVSFVALFAFITAQSITSYHFRTKASEMLEMAESNILSGNLAYSKAVHLYKDLNNIMSLPESTIKQAATVKKIKKMEGKLHQLVFDLDDEYEDAIELLSKIEGLGVYSRETNMKIAALLKNKFRLNLISGNYNAVRNLLKKIRKNRKKVLYELIENDKPLFEKIKLVVNNQGILKLTTTPVNVKVFIEKLTNNSYKTAADKERRFLGKSPIRQNMVAGDYLVTLGEEGSQVTYPITIKCAEKNIVNINLFNLSSR